MGLNPVRSALPRGRSVASGKLLHSSEPQLSPLQNGANNSHISHGTEVKIKFHREWLARYLAHSKSSVYRGGHEYLHQNIICFVCGAGPAWECQGDYKAVVAQPNIRS